MKKIKCKHIKKTNKEIYIYQINKEEEIYLCPACNINLAGEIVKQWAIETFL